MISIIVPITIAYSSLILREPRVMRLFRQSAAIIQRDTGVKLKANYRKLKIPTWRDGGYETGVIFVLNYLKYFDKVKKVGVKTMMIAPAFTRPETREEVIMGQAYICNDKGIMSYGAYRTSWGFNRAVFIHEIGHLLGAWHDVSKTYMNPAPGTVAIEIGNKEMRFSQKSVEEIKSCVGGL